MASTINMTEIYFEWWLETLKKKGLVISFEREPMTFILYQAKPVFYDQHYKRKESLTKNFNLFRPVTYTPDYKVTFSNKLVGKLFGLIFKQLEDTGREDGPGNIYQDILFFCTHYSSSEDETFDVWFDVKPPSKALRYSSKLGSSREFPIKQRLTFEKYGIYVNKVIPNGSANCLFAKTFLPERYKWTDKSGSLRKLKSYEIKAKTLNQYLTLKNIK